MTLTQILSKLKSLMYSKTETDTLLGNKAASSHTHSDYIPKDGTTSITGTGFFKSTNDSQLQICSGTSTITGGCFVGYGSEYSNTSVAGAFRIRARSGNTSYDLLGYANGTLEWNGTSIVPASSGTCNLGSNSVYFKDGYIRNLYTVSENTLTNYLFLPVIEYSDNSVWNSHTQTRCKFKNNYEVAQNRFISENSNSHWLFCIFTPADSDKTETIIDLAHYGNGERFLAPYYGNVKLGYGNCKWTDIYANNGTIQTSDRNQKQDIVDLENDTLLDAWENVNLVTYKFKSAVETKGKSARTHIGYVAQDIQEQLAKYGIDASEYGLFCHDSWEEQQEVSHEETYTEEVQTKSGETETVTKTRKVIDTPYKAKGESYALRYTECLVIECAFLRREVKRLSERLSKLEQPSTSEK